MEDFLKIIGGAVLVIVLVFFASILSGTILWIIYDHIHALFPSAATNNIIAKDLGWWDSVCITWIFGVLIKASSGTKRSND